MRLKMSVLKELYPIQTLLRAYKTPTQKRHYHTNMATRRDDDWCAHGNASPESALPAAVAQLHLASTLGRKYSSNQRIDDIGLRLGGATNSIRYSNSSSNRRPQTSGSAPHLSPIQKSSRTRRAQTSLHRKRQSATSTIRPSTVARASWRMKIDDPLHVNKRHKTGKVEFHTHLTTSESVSLFDAPPNSPETLRITDTLLQTGGHAAAESSGLNHHQQAQKVLRQARMLVKQQSQSLTATMSSFDNTTNPTSSAPLHFELATNKQVASIHHAVIRLLADSACCPCHAALLTDAATFFRTMFTHQMVAVRKEREQLRQHTIATVEIAEKNVKIKEAMLQRQLLTLTKVLSRNADRTISTLKQNVIQAWRLITDASRKQKRRKERARNVMCHALIRRGARGNLESLFNGWYSTTTKQKYERRLEKNQQNYKEDISCKMTEMKIKIASVKKEKEYNQHHVQELEGLIEVLMRSATQAAGKLEDCMQKLGSIENKNSDDDTRTDDTRTEDTKEENKDPTQEENKEEKDNDNIPKEAAELTPRSVLKTDIIQLTNRLNKAGKRMFDSGDYNIALDSIQFTAIATQTESKTEEQEQQTEMTLPQLKDMEINAEKSRLLSEIVSPIMVDGFTEPMSPSPTISPTTTASIATTTTSTEQGSQTRLTMESVGKAFNNLSKIQQENEKFKARQIQFIKKLTQLGHPVELPKNLEDSEHHVELPPHELTSATTPMPQLLPPVIIKPIVLNAETKKNLKRLEKFFGKVDLDVAADFTTKNLTDLVHLLDIHDVHPGDQIIAQGEEATWFGMVLDGKFDIEINGVGKVATCGAGTVLGELSFLGGDMERTASVKTISNGAIAAIPYKRILTLHETNSELFTKFLLLVAEGGIQKLFSGQLRLKGSIASLKKQLEQTVPLENKKEMEIFDTTDKDKELEVQETEEEEEEKEEKEKTISDVESNGSSDSGDLNSLRHGKKRKSHIHGKKKHKRGRKFKASSSSEIFYRTKVANAQHQLQDLQIEMEKEEKEMNRLRAKIKGEQVMRQQAQKEMEFMKMRLAAAGIGD